jgi:hypothetical protein
VAHQTKENTGLVVEGVTYWIRENRIWKIAALRGGD